MTGDALPQRIRHGAGRFRALARKARQQQRLRRRGVPPVGRVKWGDLRRLRAMSDEWGFDRGTPIDRYYVDDWFRRHGGEEGYGPAVVTGSVMEVGDDAYARRFGRDMTGVAVLHENETNPKATVVGDLMTGEGLPAEAYDCIVCVQTLHVLYDPAAAVRTLHRALKPGGSILATVPGITRSCVPDKYLWGDWWRYTGSSARRQFEEVFGGGAVTIEVYGNLVSAVGFLHGLAAEELRDDELLARDPDFEVVIGIRAVKAATG